MTREEHADIWKQVSDAVEEIAYRHDIAPSSYGQLKSLSLFAWEISKAYRGTFTTSPAPVAKNGRLHPNEKPVALLERLMRWLPAGLICDPFMGSGSTASAAIKAGRPFIGIEIEQEYFDVACRRIEAETRQFNMAI